MIPADRDLTPADCEDVVADDLAGMIAEFKGWVCAAGAMRDHDLTRADVNENTRANLLAIHDRFIGRVERGIDVLTAELRKKTRPN